MHKKREVPRAGNLPHNVEPTWRLFLTRPIEGYSRSSEKSRLPCDRRPLKYEFLVDFWQGKPRLKMISRPVEFMTKRCEFLGKKWCARSTNEKIPQVCIFNHTSPRTRLIWDVPFETISMNMVFYCRSFVHNHSKLVS